MLTNVNGYPVLMSASFPARGAMADHTIVLVKRPKHQYEPFIVWTLNDQTGGASSGGYYATLAVAKKDFAHRVKNSMNSLQDGYTLGERIRELKNV